ncbi:interaptin isoform X3 [Drosophila takahashii]|uniref:interaptin isoform X3 n=1 Tax=Drosophila takahashii TaxID=29030 RepID=UPI00389907F2
MFLLGICLLCSINSLLLAAYPVESQVNSKELTAPLADPADYPDLTNGLSDAEVQESLEDLTLDDLNSLDKLLDEHIGRDVEADSDGQRSQFRQAKDALRSFNAPLDDGCRDEEESDETKPNLCTKRPTCPTTKRCSKKTTCVPKTTKACTSKPTNENCKSKSGGYMDDDLIIETTKCPKPKNKKCKKPKDDFECEADDFLCHASRRSRGKESRSHLQEEQLDGPAEFVPGRDLEQLGKQNIPVVNDQGEPLDEAFNFDDINLEQSAHLDQSNSVNVGQENQVNLNQDRQSNLEKDNQISLEQKHQSNLKKDYEVDLKDMELDGHTNFNQVHQANLNPEFGANEGLNNHGNLEQEHIVKLKQEDQANFDLDYQAEFEREHPTKLELRNPMNVKRDHQINLDQEQQSNLDFGNPGNFEQEHDLENHEYQFGLEKRNQASFDNDHQANFRRGEQQINRDQKVSHVEKVEQAESAPVAEPAHMDLYERHRLARIAHRKREQAEVESANKMQMHNVEDRKQAVDSDQLMPLKPNLIKQEPLFDSDSFIASNARDPPRYLIQMQNDCIQSENDRGERRLREDRSQSEALDLDKLAEEEASPVEESNFDYEYKRRKRENKETDDAPENSKETYIKKLMDSFPRDQGGQINANAALSCSNLAHLRIKRS